MKFTLPWLKEHLDTDASLTEIVDKLTMIGLEVERVEDTASLLKPFVIASVISAVSAVSPAIPAVVPPRPALASIRGMPERRRARSSIAAAPSGSRLKIRMNRAPPPPGARRTPRGR